jgi:two-component system sensor kinase FixL
MRPEFSRESILGAGATFVSPSSRMRRSMTSFHDTTDRQKMAEAEADRFRKDLGPFVVAAETTSMAMVFTNAREANNPIVFANESFLALMGYERHEVLAQSFNFVMAGVTKRAALARIAEQFRGQPNETLEVECRRKDGRQFLAALYISPVRDGHGDVAQHFASFVDLTAHMERSRAESDNLHALYQDAPGFIATVDGPDHRFTFINAAYQRLVGHRGVVGKTVAETLPEIADQGFIGVLDEVYTTGEPFFANSLPVSLERNRGSGCEMRYLDFVYQPIRNNLNEVTGVFCEGHDVTEHRIAVEKIQSLQSELIHLSRVSAMGTMATMLAHELNQPLAAISNYTAGCRGLIAPEAPNATALEQGLKAIGEGSARAGAIIRRVREMTKRSEPRKEVFALGEAVAESIALVRLGACATVSIQDDSGAGVTVEADRIQIQQVIMNLLRNACEAVENREPRLVSVSIKVKGPCAVLSVADTGPGVSPDVAKTLFGMSDSRKPEGMGIGLSISRTIIEAHEGKIWLEESGNEGSRFCFSLPVVASRGAPRPSSSKLVSRGRPSSPGLLK